MTLVPDTIPFPVVGIGASAGGLEALVEGLLVTFIDITKLKDAEARAVG